MSLSDDAKGLRALLGRLTTFKVRAWGQSSSDPNVSTERSRAPLADADVVSSLREDGKHTVVLDIDHPAWLVRSSTPGHYHLYIDVPNGIEWMFYERLLGALAQAGVIESGYAGASMRRGHSAVRLPWVKKPGTTPPPEMHTLADYRVPLRGLLAAGRFSTEGLTVEDANADG